MKEMLEKPLPVNKTAPATFAGPAYPPIERRAATFDPKALQRLLDGDNAEIRNSIKQLITQPEFRYYDGNDLAAQRRQVLAWTKRIADTGIGRLFLPHSIKFHSGRLVSATFATRSPLRMPKLCKPQASAAMISSDSAVE